MRTGKKSRPPREIFILSHLAMEICTGIVEFVDSDRVTKGEGGKAGGVGVGGPGVVLVQPVQVVDGQQDTQAVDEDPDDIEDIVSVGTLTVTHNITYTSLYSHSHLD